MTKMGWEIGGREEMTRDRGWEEEIRMGDRVSDRKLKRHDNSLVI